jgi:hypothetical protein
VPRHLTSGRFYVKKGNKGRTLIDIDESRREMKKRIAVLVRDRQAEALRMAVGLTLQDDEVNVFVMDARLGADPAIELNLEVLRDLGVAIYTNNAENSFEFMSTEEIAKALATYDTVLPY